MPEPAGRGAAEPLGKHQAGDGRAGRVTEEPEILLGWRMGGSKDKGAHVQVVLYIV